MIWVFVALVTTLTILFLTRPMFDRGVDAASDGLAVFRGQLDELARDRELGLITDEEAAKAEREIKRRLLLASDRQEEVGRVDPRFRSIAMMACVAAGAVSVAVYMTLGSPQMTNAQPPQSDPISAEAQSVLDELNALAQNLMENPENPQGWIILGQAYMTMGRYSEAVVAFDNAISLVPDAAALYALLGQAHILAARGEPTPPAREALIRALEIDPQEPRARFFDAEIQYRDGDPSAAVSVWEDLLETGPADPGFQAMVRARLDAVYQPVDLERQGEN